MSDDNPALISDNSASKADYIPQELHTSSRTRLVTKYEVTYEENTAVRGKEEMWRSGCGGGKWRPDLGN